MKVLGLVLVLLCTCSCTVQAFQAPSALTTSARHYASSASLLRSSNDENNNNNNNAKPEYSRQLYLREEIESPFRKVRIFFYYSLGGGALTSLAISVARIAAGLSGVNADLLEESLINAGVDIVGLIVLGFAYKSDLDAQESRLKRASKGAQLARLMVRGSQQLLGGLEDTKDGATFTTSLASLRRGRGIEKRVVLAAGGKEKIDQVLKQSVELQEALTASDLLVVPVVMPEGTAPTIDPADVPPCVALPVGSGWKEIVNDEASEATKQGVDLQQDGICVILKKNGRVGQRTKGIFLDRMVGEVVERRELGLDVKNI